MTRMEALYRKVRDGEIEFADVDYTKELALAGMEAVIAGRKFSEEMVAAQVRADKHLLGMETIIAGQKLSEEAAGKRIRVQATPSAVTSQITVKTEFLDQVNALVEELENAQTPAGGE